MQPSPLQLLKLCFSGIRVLPDQNNFNEEITRGFDFNGVCIREVTETILVEEESDSSIYRVILRIAIENEEGKKAPYQVDICAYGDFHVNEKVPAEDRPNLVTVNGCSMLYGAIRELVMTLTSRSSHGMLTLPSVNFLDKIKKQSTPEPARAPASAPTKTPKKKKATSSQASK